MGIPSLPPLSNPVIFNARRTASDPNSAVPAVNPAKSISLHSVGARLRHGILRSAQSLVLA
jgi:hypothetical protein